MTPTDLLALATPDPAEVRGKMRWERPEHDPDVVKGFFGPFSAGIVFRLQGGWVCTLTFGDGAMSKHSTEADAMAALETAVREAIGGTD